MVEILSLPSLSELCIQPYLYGLQCIACFLRAAVAATTKEFLCRLVKEVICAAGYVTLNLAPFPTNL
jgi:hypothetical protein